MGGERIVRVRHRGGPPFSEAWSGLALCYAVIADYSVRISFQDAFARGRQAAEQVSTLDPTMAEPYAALGIIEASEWRYQTGVALLKRAVVLRPSFAIAHHGWGPP